jgi:hypothetical protein
LESSGAQNQFGTKIGYITDVQIDFDGEEGIQSPPEQQYFKDLVIAPNPTTGQVNITTSQELPYSVSVYNMLGQVVFQQTGFQDGNMDLSFLPRGVYMIKVSLDRHSIAKKVVLQ